MALRMCLDRIGPPRRERAVPIKLLPVRDAADLAGTMTAIIAAAGEGAISAGRGRPFGAVRRDLPQSRRDARLRTALAAIREFPSNPALLRV
jgi:hypothetical protein